MEDSDIVGHPEVADLVIGPPQRDSADLNEVDRTTQVKDEGDDDNDRDDLNTAVDSSKKKVMENPIDWVKNKYHKAKSDRYPLDDSLLVPDSRQQSCHQSLKPQSDSDGESNTGGLHQNLSRAKDGRGEQNVAILGQIKQLQQQLLDLERKALPKMRAEDHEAVWESNLLRTGPDEERKRWDAEKRLRKSTLLMSNSSYGMGSNWMRKVDGELNRKFGDDLRYNEKLLKLGKEWERKRELQDRIQRSRSEPSESSGGDSDLTTVYDSDDFLKTLQGRHRLLKDQLDYDVRRLKLEFDYRRKKIRSRKVRYPDGGGHRERPAQLGRSPSPSPPATPEQVEGEESASEAPKAPTVVPSAKSELKRVQWAEFKSLQLNEEYSYAIYVLMGEPVLDYKDRGYWRQRGHEQVVGHPYHPVVQDKNYVYRPGSPLPERLRIHSRELIAILSSIHRSYIDNRYLSDEPVILLRPFRFLVYYEEAIRDWHSKLHKRFSDSALAATEFEQIPGTEDSPPAQSSKLKEPANIVSTNGEDDERDQQQENKVTTEGQSEIVQDDAKEAEREDDSNSRIALAHLDILLQFMDKDMKQRIDLLRGPGTCEKVVFSDLWHLFRPGDFVICNGGRQAFRILRMEGIPHQVNDLGDMWHYRLLTDNEEIPLSIQCVYVDFDGKQFGPITKTFRIKRFEKEKSVTSLEIYPLRYHSLQETKEPSAEEKNSEERLWKYFVARGRKFLHACSVSIGAFRPMYYRGPAIEPREEVESQVVIDVEAALAVEGQKEWEPKVEILIGQAEAEEEETTTKSKHECRQECCRYEFVHDDSFVDKRMNEEFMSRMLPKTREEMPSVTLFPRQLDTKAPDVGLSEEELVIMSYRVMGFVMRNRTWAQLDLTYLTEDQPQEDGHEDRDKPKDKNGKIITAFDRLVLPPGHQDLILSLVTQHFRDKASDDDDKDFVRGKGKGLILLLHGAPGVGKTTTAEGIAEKFNKPLFQLTCGDLGTTAKKVEASLAKNFALANRWGCVLLLDEADVFLSQRTRDDFVRNSLVAVFLRVLEYYAGILFLTTNRVGDFDEAFASRIHISLYYPELTAEFAPEVFNINLNLIESRFTRKGRLFKTDRMRIGSFCERYWRDHPFDQWNGRQIRNACLTAVALAEFEAQGENANDILKPKAEVELKVSHFEQVAKAYLEFSEHMRNIYGTHAARRAKEAGLRAMWVDEKGKLVASVGPKESGILKGSRKNKFLQVASGQVNYGGPEQPQQQRQSMPYRGGGRAAGEHGYEPEQRSYYQGPERHHEEYGGNLPRPQGYRERDYEQADYKGDYRDNANQRLDAPRDTRFRGPPNRSQERPHPNQDSRYD